jgi:O-acetyl-ADP-ribose deacetylase (regulator of RNase III)
MQLRVLIGDITKCKVDAIVNSANPTLLGGGGVDGAIHKAAGVGLSAECRGFRGCPVGEARLTKGFRLPAKYVIHTAGPIWVGGRRNEEKQLASCYASALDIAREKHFSHIAFAAISIGANRYPVNRAASVAITTIMNECAGIDRIDLICSDKSIQTAYSQAAVAFWLEQLAEVSQEELPEMLKEAMPSLVMLCRAEEEPSPLKLANEIESVKVLLQPFLSMPRHCGPIDMNQAAKQILDSIES